MRKFIYIVFFVTSFGLNAQNLIITDDSTYSGTSNNVLLEIYSASSNKGVLIPRLTTSQRTSIATTVDDDGLVVYDTDTHSFWVWSDNQWKELGDKQTLTYNPNTGELTILNGNSVTIPDNDNQTLGLSSSTLSITNGNSVDLSGINTDDQTLSISGHTLSIEGGNSVILPDNDNQALSFNLSTNELSISNGDTVDLSILAGSNDSWKLTGNFISSGKFLGTTNNMPLEIYTNDSLRLRITQNGHLEVLNSRNSIYIGEEAGKNDTINNYNIGIGYQTLYSDTTGEQNIAIGYQALFSNAKAWGNVAIGYQALYSNAKYGVNIAIGTQALYSNNNANDNIAIGYKALYSNTGGIDNIALGYKALFRNNVGGSNIAIGPSAMENNDGEDNIGIGYWALSHNTTGSENVAIGNSALSYNTSGWYNTALGYTAFLNGSDYYNSTALGYSADITASNQVRVGNSNVTSIGGYVSWTNISDKRFKKDIRENVHGLDFIMKLRPVTYHLDMDAIAQFLHTPDSLRLFEAEKTKGQMVYTGFIAQEVEQAAEDVGYDFSGVDRPKNTNDYYGLRYAEFVVPLVKATQEQEHMIESQQNVIEMLRKQNEKQQIEIELLKKQNTEILKKLEELKKK